MKRVAEEFDNRISFRSCRLWGWSARTVERFEGVDETHGCATVWTGEAVSVFGDVGIVVGGLSRFDNAERSPGEL